MPYTPPSYRLLPSDFYHDEQPAPSPLKNYRLVAESSIVGLSQDLGKFQPEKNESKQDQLPVIRGKSGDLILPVLRTSLCGESGTRHVSIGAKIVHFGDDLVETRLFSPLDSPISISSKTSTDDDYDSHLGSKFWPHDKPDAERPPFKPTLPPMNLLHDSAPCKALPVVLRTLSLAANRRSINGSVAVANLAAGGAVACRFTFDDWQTVSEVSADYCGNVAPIGHIPGYDRYVFSINISDIVNLESTCFSACIRYSVEDLEFWDNNGSSNFQIRFGEYLQCASSEDAQVNNSSSSNGISSHWQQLSRTKTLSSRALSLQKPAAQIQKSDMGRVDSGHAETTYWTPAQGATSSDRHTFYMTSTKLVRRTEEPVYGQKLALYDRNFAHSVQTSVNTPYTGDSGSKTYRGVRSADTSLLYSSYAELLEKYCFFDVDQGSGSTLDSSMERGTYAGTWGIA